MASFEKPARFPQRHFLDGSRKSILQLSTSASYYPHRSRTLPSAIAPGKVMDFPAKLIIKPRRSPPPIGGAWGICWLSSSIVLLSLVMFGGCTQGPYPLGPGYPAGNPWGTTTAANVNAAQAQMTELQRRVELLDKDNRQLQTQLAQSEQQSQVYRDELGLMRQQLADTVQRLEEARLLASDTQQQFQGLQASTRFRGGAALQANTNLRQIAEALQAAGLPALYEGDLTKIIVPADQLFQPGTAFPLPQAAGLLSPLAAQLTRLAPRQRIGVEAFWDDSPLMGGNFSNSHQLTNAQAIAAFELLAAQGGIPRQAMTTVGYGSTRPRQSNESAPGRAANRRIEIIIYPDSY